MDWKIPLFKIDWDEADVTAVTEIIRSGMYWAEGPVIAEFEQALAAYTGAAHCAAFSSGTAALHAIMLAYGIGPGDEVIVPSFSFISTANAPLFAGAVPVFADIEERTFGLDPEDTAARITDRTRMIVAVHYGGCPARIAELRALADEHNLILVEDAAEALGARTAGRAVGTVGHCAMFSFCQNKIAAAGEGGAVVTDNPEIDAQLRLIRSHGRDSQGDYFTDTGSTDYIQLGYNFRMPSLLAALSLSQLRRVEDIIAARAERAGFLTARLAETCPELAPLMPRDDDRHVYQLYTVRVPEKRDQLREHLAAGGIMTKVYFDPIHRTHFYANVRGSTAKLPMTEELAQHVLTLPLYPSLSESEMLQMVEAIAEFY